MALGISPNNLNKISQVYLSKISEHHKKDADGNTIPHEDENIDEAKVDMKKYLDKKAKMLTKKRDAQSDAAKNNPHFDSTQPSPSGRNKYEEVELGEGQKCWKGYEKKGTKKMFGKTYNNCVKKEDLSNWRTELELSERVGGAGTLVRQGVKVGGKKGGKAVQAGQSKAIAAGQGAKESVKGGNKSKMVGTGRGEKIGAVIGGTAGALAGGVVDGPFLPVGDIIGGIAGGKIGGKIGRQFDKMGAKKPVKEENLDEFIKFTDAKKRRDALPSNQKDFTKFKPGINLNLKKNVDITKDTPGALKSIGKQKFFDPIKDGAGKIIDYAGDKIADKVGGAVTKAGVAGAAAITGGLLAKRLMSKKSDKEVVIKKESFSNWREDVDYEGKDDSKKIEEAKSPAWQRKAGKSESGGLNKKGVASYRAANPGSKLKTAVTTKPSKLKKGSKAANRRKSFCSRMKGMKKKLTSAKTARDPDSRINKSLRKWNC